MYRPSDIEIVTKNLEKLEEEAKNIYLNKYEPTLREVSEVRNVILDFVKDKKRIIYGGYAQNSLIVAKDKDAGFYKDTDLADIEFYSPDPVGDTIDLCDLLNSKGFKYVEGKEGVHPETYKIFSNFINYTDITFMPEIIYNNCPTIKINGLLMTHPHLMLVDSYRVYSDPMTSYFRLRKAFTRTNKLIRYYPLDEDMLYGQEKLKEKVNEKVLRFIRHKIIHNSKLIVVGHYAFNQLMKFAKMSSTYLVYTTYYQLIATDYNNETNKIANILRKEYKSKLTIKKYYPYYQFLDKSTEYYINGQLVLRVYGANDRCIVYRYSDKKKTHFGTYQLIFMYILIQYNIAKIRHNNFNEHLYGHMIIAMINARDKYLTDHNLTVLDKSLFQEFTFQCIGEPKDMLREDRLQMVKKREAGKLVKFLYKPTGNPGKKPQFKFNKSTGELM